MKKCDDCWCEYYDKNNGNCDKCHKQDKDQSNIKLSVIIKRRVNEHMKLDGPIKEKTHAKSR